MTDSDPYERAGFGHSMSEGCALVSLSSTFARGFTEAAFPTGADLTAQVAATARLVEAVRAKARPVVFTVIASPRPPGRRSVAGEVPGREPASRGNPAVELDPRLLVEREDIIIVKKGASAFFGTNLVAVLAAHAVDTVVVCGATTCGCVRASVVDSMQYTAFRPSSSATASATERPGHTRRTSSTWPQGAPT